MAAAPVGTARPASACDDALPVHGRRVLRHEPAVRAGSRRYPAAPKRRFERRRAISIPMPTMPLLFAGSMAMRLLPRLYDRPVVKS